MSERRLRIAFFSVFVFSFRPLHPTPPLSARLLPHPILLTPLLPQCSQPQTLAFCMKGFNPVNNPVCLSQNKPVREGSPRKSGRLEQEGAQPLVISPVSGSAACLDPQPSAQYTLPCCLPDWLTDWVSLHCYLLSLPLCPAPSLLPSYFPPWRGRTHRFGKVLLRPASGQLEDGTERTFPSAFILSLTFTVSVKKHMDGLFVFFMEAEK